MIRTHASPLRLLAALAVLVLGAGTAPEAASAYIEQLVATGPIMGQPGRSSTHKIWIEGDKIRVEDSSTAMATILRKDKGVLYMINPAKMTYSEMTFEQLQALANMGLGMMGGKAQEQPQVTIEKTGETAKIGDWNTSKVLVKVSGPIATEMTLWLSKDIALDMSTWVDLAQGMGMKVLVGDTMEQLATLEGYPVKQESKVTMMGMNVFSTTELKAFKPAAGGDDSLYELPAGLTKVEGLPGMPAAPTQPKP